MTSIILAGGKSSRFGRNKALQTIGGKTLVQYVVDRLAPLSTEIIIVTAQGGEEIYHRKPFASCHSEEKKQPKNLAQDRLREAISETLCFLARATALSTAFLALSSLIMPSISFPFRDNDQVFKPIMGIPLFKA